MFVMIYALCARNVKYIILNKGGETLSIITYHALKKKSTIHLPIGMVRAICVYNYEYEKLTFDM